MSDWLQIRVPVTHETEDAIVNFLFEIGSTGCQQHEGYLFSYFPGNSSRSNLTKTITEYLSQLCLLGFKLPTAEIEITELANRDWNSEWKKHFKPLTVSQKFIVKPTWEKLEPPVDKHVLEIDPKQAFGTGHHETTRMMLQLLEKYCSSSTSVLDVGTGTGILAIAAAKLNAAKIVAIDVDPVAVEAALENCRANASKIPLLVGEIHAISPDAHFDLILANLNKTVVLELLKQFNYYLAKGGFLIISGILAEEADEVKKHAANNSDLAFVEQANLGEWVGLIFTKRC